MPFSVHREHFGLNSSHFTLRDLHSSHPNLERCLLLLEVLGVGDDEYDEDDADDVEEDLRFFIISSICSNLSVGDIDTRPSCLVIIIVQDSNLLASNLTYAVLAPRFEANYK